MLQNAYFLAKIGADTAEIEPHFAEMLPIWAWSRSRSAGAAARPSRPRTAGRPSKLLATWRRARIGRFPGARKSWGSSQYRFRKSRKIEKKFGKLKIRQKFNWENSGKNLARFGRNLEKLSRI